MAEIKPKGKPPKDPAGRFTVTLRFSDGSTLDVRNMVDEVTALSVYHEHIAGIGARVGTTKQVTIFYIAEEGDRNEAMSWKYKATGGF